MGWDSELVREVTYLIIHIVLVTYHTSYFGRLLAYMYVQYLGRGLDDRYICRHLLLMYCTTMPHTLRDNTR